jgi:ABC-type glycerol-3-phosphate transport system permease component
MKRVPSYIVKVILIIWACLMVFPLLYMVITSFKTDQEILKSPWELPEKIQFDNYIQAWIGNGDITLGTNFINSIIVTVSTLVLLTIVSTLAGYALARHKFPGSKLIFLILIALIAVPVHALLVPIYNFIDQLQLLNNLVALILVYTAFALPFSIIIMRSYFETIPTATEESARLDGCTEFGVFWHIGLPMSWGAVSTVIIVNVVNIWSELLFANVLLTQPESRTLPLGISLFSQNMYSSSDGLLYAGLSMATVPLLLVYLFFQKQIVKGMSAGSIK